MYVDTYVFRYSLINNLLNLQNYFECILILFMYKITTMHV